MHRSLLLATLMTSLPALAAETPERQRAVGAAQPVGVVHTVRQIPEACARLEGAFTGDAAAPYRLTTVRTSPQCQPRARYVDPAGAQPGADKGWKLNDVVRVPNAACPAQQAVVRIWRLPAENRQALDGQGQSRIYLEEAKRQAAAGQIAAVTAFTAQLQMEGQACH